MLQINISEADLKELQYQRYHHPHPRVQMKMEALLLKAKGLLHQQIADCVGISENTLRTYLKQYQKGGIKALLELKFYRPSSELEEHKASLEAHFRANPPAPATIAQVLAEAAIAQVTGLKHRPTQIRLLLFLNFPKKTKTRS